MTHEETRRIRVGVFVFGAIALLIALILLLGRSQSLFVRKAVLHASFLNTGGLIVGTPVRLAGVDIGVVQSIRFEASLKVKTVHVALAVEQQYLDRIREDSRARLTSKGLLGDMIIDITVGSTEAEPLKNGAELLTEEGEGFAQVAAAAKDAVDQVRILASETNRKLETILTDDFGKDLKRIAHATADVAESIEHGKGLAHTLIYEPEPAQKAQALLTQAQRTVSDSDQAIRRLDRLISAVESNDGTLHSLIYRDDGARLVVDARKGVDELSEILRQVRVGNGTLHSLVYQRDGENIIENLGKLSAVLRQLGDEVAQGKGTIGALIKDPSVYEDLKTILGNVKRSWILRAVMRYAIKNDHLGASPE